MRIRYNVLTISRICEMKKMRVIPYKISLKWPFCVIETLNNLKNRYYAGCFSRPSASKWLSTTGRHGPRISSTGLSI